MTNESELGEREVVWEVAGAGVGSMVCSEGLFIGQSGLERGVSRRWPGWVSGDVRWRKPGAAALGACWQGEVMASGHCGQVLASSRRSASCREAEEERGGSELFPPFPSMSHGPGWGRGGWGSTEGESLGMATGLGHTISASSTVASIFLDFAHQVFGQMPARIQISNF
jgi:hypothetical protein